MDKDLQEHNEWVARLNLAARQKYRKKLPVTTDKQLLLRREVAPQSKPVSKSIKELLEKDKARIWLHKLDRLSDTGVWFEQFARRNYNSEIDAAVEFLRNESQNNL